MIKKKYFILLFIILFIILISLIISSKRPEPDTTKITFQSSNTISAEIARTNEEKAKGLMNRDFLKEDAGMIFVYGVKRKLSFWMKNTLIPLDIIFLDHNKNIVHLIRDMEPCLSDPCKSYSSEIEVMYAIEVNSGFILENNLSVGQLTVFDL